MRRPRNVLTGELQPCSMSPVTGYYRDGCCRSGPDDIGQHLICASMTAEFLEFTRSRGNDLVTPSSETGFPGLKPGDRWCLCIERWREALDAGMAPPVILEATHISVLEYVELAVLRDHALDTDLA